MTTQAKSPPIQIEDRHLKIVTDILNKYPHTFSIFGSRAKGTAKTFSDLDLCIEDKITSQEIMRLEEAFENSNLPYKVDLVVWDRFSHSFQSLIRNDLVCIQKAVKPS